MSSFPKVLFVLVMLVVSFGMTQAMAQEAEAPRLLQKHVVDLDAMKERRIVRVLVPYSKTIYFVDKGPAVRHGCHLRAGARKIPQQEQQEADRSYPYRLRADAARPAARRAQRGLWRYRHGEPDDHGCADEGGGLH
ncbi:hypothetical protein [Rhizobium sp. CF142]|uniref:hypothetical protein n=1 Tax=Rhizobium sp. CF142 TaxID=1144314 RepID=UPI001FCCB046|nr:hypothetical protein [Rhizobium sp. CF142]